MQHESSPRALPLLPPPGLARAAGQWVRPALGRRSCLPRADQLPAACARTPTGGRLAWRRRQLPALLARRASACLVWQRRQLPALSARRARACLARAGGEQRRAQLLLRACRGEGLAAGGSGSGRPAWPGLPAPVAADPGLVPARRRESRTAPDGNAVGAVGRRPQGLAVAGKAAPTALLRCAGAGARVRGGIAGQRAAPDPNPKTWRAQRRCYWLLEGDDHVVLVHYLAAKPDGARALRMGSQGSLALEAPAPGALGESGLLQGAQVHTRPHAGRASAHQGRALASRSVFLHGAWAGSACRRASRCIALLWRA
jgi:hypothetical protein